MLQITIPSQELWDSRTNEFVVTKETRLELEHSLIALSKWESKWEKPFLSKQEKTNEETVDYIRCMTITRNVDPGIYLFLTMDNLQAVNDYIAAPMTATTFSNDRSKPSREIITAEIIYYWMIAYNIPFECEKWHLNRLLTLIRVCSVKNGPSKKMSKRDILRQNAQLNAMRRKQMNTTG